ncbi:MAG: hypothetical protein LBI80_02650 [Endomicrobium sp.]|jgi:hypothetical protein|nr:hypothetical protein [Endomicrobium sp.]
MKGMSIEEQCQYLGISRSKYYYEKNRKKAIVGWIGEVMREMPFYG